MKKQKPHRVPTVHLAELVQRHLDGSDMTIRGLAERIGVSEMVLHNMLSQRYKTTDFDTADKIVTKLDVFSWFSMPLVQHYWPKGTKPPNGLKAQKCANPKCDKWFELTPRAMRGGKEYCTKSCMQNAKNARFRKTKHGRKVNRASARRDYNKHAEKRRETMREYYEKNKEARKQYMRDYRARRRAETSGEDDHR